MGALAQNLSKTDVGTAMSVDVVWPDTSGGFFMIGLVVSEFSNAIVASNDSNASFVGVGATNGSVLSVLRNGQDASQNPLPVTINTGDIVRLGYRPAVNTLYIDNVTQGFSSILQFQLYPAFNTEPVHLSIMGQLISSVDFTFPNEYSLQQATYELNLPSDFTKTYLVSNANTGSAVSGKLLKQGDFVDFITNEDDEVVDAVVSRLVSDSNIRDTISTALSDPNSSLSSLVMSLGGVDAVVSALDGAVNNNPSDLTTSLDSFLAYLLNNDQSLFYEALQTQVQDAVYAIIQDNLQNNGMIYEAIAQYVEDSTTGVNGHAAIQTAIEENLNNYADGIGVGANGQVYLDVYEAAQAAISNEIQSGGIIDTAIQAAVNP